MVLGLSFSRGTLDKVYGGGPFTHSHTSTEAAGLGLARRGSGIKYFRVQEVTVTYLCSRRGCGGRRRTTNFNAIELQFGS